MNILRRHTLGALAALASFSLHVQPALAQSFPGKPITFINNFPPGGPSDILARSVSAVLQETFKQPVVVESKPGAAGAIGAAAVAKAPADGHTLLVGIDTTFTVTPHLMVSMPFKPADLKPVVIMASSGLLMGVNPGTGIKSFGDLLTQGRQRTLNFSSAGNGSPGHLAASILSSSTPVKTAHIAYRGNTPAVTAVIGGEVDGGILATPGMIPHVKSGRINALAVTSARRSALMPQLPTVAELGLKGLEQEVLYLVMAPAATPESVMQVLQKGIIDALRRPEAQERMKNLDLFFEGQTGAEAAQRLASMSARYGQIVRNTGMIAD
ncbi:MAG: Bug family tripartite tricarboxylate transporter substrate binding protein [Gammaproteobacteria bacterium]